MLFFQKIGEVSGIRPAHGKAEGPSAASALPAVWRRGGAAWGASEGQRGSALPSAA